MEGEFFSDVLLEWYRINKRDLPWRSSNNPYIVWLSEIILQQTRVDQGMPYFYRFVERFPDVLSLANATEDEIFKLWQGLGYYNRARNLHYTAKYIRDHLEGQFPSSYDELIRLKGIGEYTAAAIMSFAYNKTYAAVDGNVYRVLARIFGIEDFIDTSKGKKVFQELANSLISKKHPGLYNQAIMDFGSLQCTPTSPACGECPFITQCYAYNNEKGGIFPRKKGKTKQRKRYFYYLDIRSEGMAFLKKRVLNDIWQGLYEFPLIELEEKLPFEELIKTKDWTDLWGDNDQMEIIQSHSFKHILSHQIIYASFYQIRIDHFDSIGYDILEEDSLHNYGVPKMIENYLNKLC